MLKQLKWLLIFALFVILTFILLWSRSRTSIAPFPKPTSQTLISPSPSASPQPHIDWKLYQNPKYDYQFKFDSQWLINDTLPHTPRYDRIVIQNNFQPIIQITYLKTLQPAPITIEEFLDRIRSQTSSDTTYFKTTNFGRQHIYAVLASSSRQTSYYFLHKGLPFELTFYGYAYSQLPSSYLYFLDHFSLF